MQFVCPDNFRFLTELGSRVSTLVNEHLAEVLADGRRDPWLVHLRQTDGKWSLKGVEFPPQMSRDSMVIDIDYASGFRLQFPLLLASAQKGRLKGGHLVYEHVVQPSTLNDAGSEVKTTLRYVGQTSRSWQKRLTEHRHAARSGSNTLFHRALRNHGGAVVMVRVLDAGLSSDGADRLEEDGVGSLSLYPLGLNMIPGGKAGAKFLFQHAGPRADVSPDRREETLSEVIRRSRSAGANAALSARWSDDAFAIRMICAAQNRLKPEQISAGRVLAAAGHNVETVAEMIGAQNVQQAKRMLAGETYSRVS